MVDLIQAEQSQFSSHAKAIEQKAQSDKEFKFFGEDGFSFWDFVDIVNPLQHIPLVSTVYRDMSEDEIDPGSRLVGGTLFGGPVGLASSTFNVILDHNTGKDMGEHVMAMFEGEEADTQPQNNDTLLAENQTITSEPKSYASYASLVPQGEEDAFAAGQASLRMADLYEFMNTNTAEEVPLDGALPSQASPVVQAQAQAQVAAGSAGTWAPVALTPSHFPTERTPQTDRVIPTEQPQKMTFSEQVSQLHSGSSVPSQFSGFKANQSHLESISALQAFARDVKAQEAQQKSTQLIEQQMSPNPITTSQLSQTNSEWFANMMNNNMDRFETQTEIDRVVEDVDP